MYRNRGWTEAPRGNRAGVITYGRNSWMQTGHCRRCANGLGHTLRRRGAGGERPSGVSLSRPGAHFYEDEMAPGEKVTLRRRIRAQGRAILAREIRDAGDA